MWAIFTKPQENFSRFFYETGKKLLAEHKRNLRPANLAKVDDNNFNKKNGVG